MAIFYTELWKYMLNQQLLAIMGSLLTFMGFFSPMGRDPHCRGFFQFTWDEPFFHRFTCAASEQGNMLHFWGDRTMWLYHKDERIASVILIVLIAITGLCVVAQLYKALLFTVSGMIACTICLYNGMNQEYMNYQAWIFLIIGYVLLLISTSFKKDSSQKNTG